MRPSIFIAGAAVLLLFGMLGFRILDLEQRVAHLAEQVDKHSPEGLGPPTPAQSATSVTAAPSPDLERRLSALEKRVETLQKTNPLLGSTGDRGADRLHSEEAILSVVERENSRIRDVQLEWHKARWLEQRKQQLAVFATQFKLEPSQTSALYSALEAELSSMTEVMRRPSFAEDPDQVASDWQKILSETDQRAQATLTPEQYQSWLQGRFFERKVLWPWLPDNAPQTAQR